MASKILIYHTIYIKLTFSKIIYCILKTIKYTKGIKMSKQKSKNLFLLIVASTLIIGCGSTSKKNTSEPVELTPTNQAQTTTKEIPTNAGVTSQETTIEVESKDETATSELTIPAGTAFLDASGQQLESVTPQISLTQDKKDTKEKLLAQTKLKFTDKNGNKIIPTEPFDIKVKAPSGAKPGEEVKVSIPTDATKVPTHEKLVIFIVDANGFISIRLFPNVFKNSTVILIIIEKEIPLTGATGGN